MPCEATPDYLIVGGGAAGCILASRLSEDSRRRVLLIEAGKDTPPESVPADIRDVYPVSYANPAYFWRRLTAVGQPGQEEIPYSQPRVMGGGTSVMGMWALRGLPQDYDRWRQAGAMGWGWDDVLPYFCRIERDLDFGPPFHGQHGPIPVRRHPPTVWPRFALALAEAAGKRGIPLREDINADFEDGVFAVPVANEPGGRVSAADAYLGPAVRSRSNLEILSRTVVLRLIVEGRRVTGVQIVGPGGPQTINAEEVILCAGAIYSPVLMLRSGIGPAEDLARTGVKPALDLPGVGRNLQNHPVLQLACIVRPAARQSPELRTYGLACARLSSGLASDGVGDIHLQIIAQSGGAAHGTRIGVVGASLYAPNSRGHVQLSGPGSEQSPRINFNLLTTGSDRVRMAWAIRKALDLLSEPDVRRSRYSVVAVTPSSLVRRLNRPGLVYRSASRLLAAALDGPSFLRNIVLRQAGRPLSEEAMAAPGTEHELLELAMPVFHPTGTCAMGPSASRDTVVDSDCRVHGVANLRVVDASVIPTIPRANTFLPVMMLAERASDLIRQPARAS